LQNVKYILSALLVVTVRGLIWINKL